MKIRRKLLIAPLAALGILAVGGFFIFRSFQDVININKLHDVETDELILITKLPADLEKIRTNVGEILLGEDKKDELKNRWEKYFADIETLESVLARPNLLEKEVEEVEEAEEAEENEENLSEKNSLELLAEIKEKSDLFKLETDRLASNYTAEDIDASRKSYEIFDAMSKEFSETFEDMIRDNVKEIDLINLLANSVQKEAQNLILALFLSIILLSTLFAILNAHFLSKSINQVKKIASEILAGNLGERAVISAKDEVGDLARSFNEMVDRLQEAQIVLEKKVKERTMILEKSKENVEKEVRERTKELEETVESLEQMNRQMVNREMKMIELKEKIKKLESR